MKTKDLIINGIIYAKYEIDKDKSILFLKSIQPINKELNDEENENITANIIRLIENAQVKLLAYLNV